MVNENLNFNNIEDEEPGFDFKTIIMKLFIYWKWILLSIVLCLGCAYVYLQMQTPVYRVSGRIMIHDKQKGGYQDQMTALQQDFGIMSSSGGLDNEIEIMMICMRNTLSMSPISQRLGYNMRRFYPVVYERVNKKSTEFLDQAVRHWLESSYKKGYITKSSNCDYVAKMLLNAMIGSVGSDMVDASDSQEYIAKITYAMLIFVRGLCTIEGIKIIDSLYDKYFSNISQTISLSND
jgi:hypothetical protein